MADARRFDSERELERKPGAVSHCSQPELLQEGQTGGLVQSPVQAQDAKSGAVVEGGVLKHPAAPILTNFTSTWTESPGSGFSKSLSWRGARFRGRRKYGKPRSTKIRCRVPWRAER